VLRVDRRPGSLVLSSRLARPRVLAVLGGALAGVALASARAAAPRLALGLGAAAALVVVLGGRTLRARFERGQVNVRPAVPFARAHRRPLARFRSARIETFADARRRRAERLAREYAERSGKEMPVWLRPPDAPGANDGLRRVVLVAADGEPLPVTSWLAAEEDLEPARSAVESVLG
jgi:hypothetical protein